VIRHSKQQTSSRLGILSIRSALTAVLLLAGLVQPALNQSKKDPLNDTEVEEVREVADQPIERVKLYMKFIEQRTDAIDEIAGDTRIQDKPAKLHNMLEEYTRLVDELQDNLDSYDETHSDVRKALKELIPATQKWLVTLNKPAPDQSYDFSRKTAVEAGESLNEQARKLQVDQEKWFAEQKKKNKEAEKSAGP
jgi:hypothetical protein